MKLFDVKKHPDLPVIIGTWYEGFKFVRNGADFGEAANALLDEQTEPVFYIIDLSQLKTISIEGVTETANSGAKNQRSSYRHPMRKEMLIISDQRVVKMAVTGAKTATFGNLKVKHYETLDEALDYVKENV